MALMATSILWLVVAGVAQAQRPLNCFVVQFCADPTDPVDLADTRAACRETATSEGFRQGFLMDRASFDASRIPLSPACPPPLKGEDCASADFEFLCVGIAG
jgi:hypothetical protein